MECFVRGNGYGYMVIELLCDVIPINRDLRLYKTKKLIHKNSFKRRDAQILFNCFLSPTLGKM